MSGLKGRHKALCSYLLNIPLIFIVNGMWAAWSRWSQCTQSCGIGERIRSRKCSNPSPENNGEYCIGPRSEKEFCLIKNCAADTRGKAKILN